MARSMRVFRDGPAGVNHIYMCNLVGSLPHPPVKANHAACSLFCDGDLFAYACGSDIAIVHVSQMRIANVLHSRSLGSISALAWHPSNHSTRDLKSTSHLHIAAGDTNGEVLVLDVPSGVILHRLSESSPAAHMGKINGLAWVLPRPELLLILHGSASLTLWDARGGAVVWRRDLSSGLHPPTATYERLTRDPYDCRRICLTGTYGCLALVDLEDPYKDLVELKQLRVNAGSSPPGSSLSVNASFCSTRDLLFVLLPRELVVVDLELGIPISSQSITGGLKQPAFTSILSISGTGTNLGCGENEGCQVLHCLHQDGSVSVWAQAKGEGCRHVQVAHHRLTPPPARGSGLPVQLMAVATGLVPRARGEGEQVSLVPSCTESEEKMLQTLRSALLPDRASDAPSSSSSWNAISQDTPCFSIDKDLLLMCVTGDGKVWKWSTDLRPPHKKHPRLVSMLHSLPRPALKLAMLPKAMPSGVMGVVLTGSASRSVETFGVDPSLLAPPSASPLPPTLIASLSVHKDCINGARCINGRDGEPWLVTYTSVLSSPVESPQGQSRGQKSQSASKGGGGSQGGASITGTLSSFAAMSTAAAGLAAAVAAGVASSVVTAASSQASLPQPLIPTYRNGCCVTCLASHQSTYFREVGNETSPLVGIRASPSGCYILLLFASAPAELWTLWGGQGEEEPLGGGINPVRLRLLDLPFSTVDFCHPTLPAPPPAPGCTSGSPTNPSGDPSASISTLTDLNLSTGSPLLVSSLRKPMYSRYGNSSSDSSSSPSLGTQANGGGSIPGWQDSLPEENLAFTLVDGRCGVLSVEGKRVGDTKAVRPQVNSESSQSLDLRATAIAALGTTVLLGDEEGRLIVWDTKSGKAQLTPTGFGRVIKLLITPVNASSSQATSNQSTPSVWRVAALFAHPQPTQHLSQGINPSSPPLPSTLSSGGGFFGVYDLDLGFKLRACHASAAVCAVNIGGVNDLGWLPLSIPLGGGYVLAVTMESGALGLIDVTTQSPSPHPMKRSPAHHPLMVLARSSMLRDVMSGQGQGFDKAGNVIPRERGGKSEVIGGGTNFFPRPWSLVIRLLIQAGIHPDVLASSEEIPSWDIRLKGEILSRLPRACHKGVEAAFVKETQEDLAARAETESRDRISEAAVLKALAAAAAAERADNEAAVREAAAVAPAASSFPFIKGLGEAFRTSPVKASNVKQSTPTTAAPSKEREGNPISLSRSSITNTKSILLPELLRHISRVRNTGLQAVGSHCIFYPAELKAYSRAFSSPSQRLSFAAKFVSEDPQEWSFWQSLPKTLASALSRHLHEEENQRVCKSIEGGTTLLQGLGGGNHMASGPGGPVEMPSVADEVDTEATRGIKVEWRRTAATVSSANALTPYLWDEDLVIAEASERASWHDKVFSNGLNRTNSVLVSGELTPSSSTSPSSQGLTSSIPLAERRVLECVALGDTTTAVAYLLASTPSTGSQYYRDALITMALASTLQVGPHSKAKGGGGRSGSTLHVQACKVIAAHSASVGDVLLSVPLHCAAGLYAEAVAALQDAGLWRLSLSLLASHDGLISVSDRKRALQRFAYYVLQSEGSVWRCLGLLVSAGCIPEALRVMMQERLPDAAAALLDVCLHEVKGASSLLVASSSLQQFEHVSHYGSKRSDASSSSHGSSDNEAAPAFDLIAMVKSRYELHVLDTLTSASCCIV